MLDIPKELRAYRVPDALIQTIQALIVRDPLTGLYNRRFFEEALAKTAAAALRYNQPLSLLLLDMDDFKSINDNQGYEAGDQALRALANILLETCREADITCRLGGDEFVIILPNTNARGAKKLKSRIRAALTPPLHASIGTASLPDDLLAGAEADLRSQKRKPAT